MAEYVRELGAQGRIDGRGNSALNGSGESDVGEGDAFGREEGARRKVLFEGRQGAYQAVQDIRVNLRKELSDLDWKDIRFDSRVCCRG